MCPYLIGGKNDAILFNMGIAGIIFGLQQQGWGETLLLHKFCYPESSGRVIYFYYVHTANQSRNIDTLLQTADILKTVNSLPTQVTDGCTSPVGNIISKKSIIAVLSGAIWSNISRTIFSVSA